MVEESNNVQLIFCFVFLLVNHRLCKGCLQPVVYNYGLYKDKGDNNNSLHFVSNQTHFVVAFLKELGDGLRILMQFA